MRKQLIGTISLGALSVIGLEFWEPPVQAAGENKTVHIVLIGGAPVVQPGSVEINADGSITWVPDDAAIRHRILRDGTNDPITNDFNDNGTDTVETATHTFTSKDVVKYHCKYHSTMKGTITVK
jgi:plastocyanin